MPALEDALRGAAAGDEQAMAELYDGSVAHAWNLALLMAGDRDRAADIVAAAYRDIWSDAAGGARSAHNARTWVLSMVRERAIVELCHVSAAENGALVRGLLHLRVRLARALTRTGT